MFVCIISVTVLSDGLLIGINMNGKCNLKLVILPSVIRVTSCKLAKIYILYSSKKSGNFTDVGMLLDVEF